MMPKYHTSHPGRSALLLSCLVFLLLNLTFVLHAQTPAGICGSFPDNSGFSAASIPPDADLIDQFGRTYRWEDLQIERQPANSQARITACQTGAFDLEFNGFDTDEENTICEVFGYLSTLVSVGAEGSTPLIQVVKEPFTDASGNPDNSTLGIGVVYWQLECGIINPLMFDVMNSSLGQGLAPGFASAVIRINSNVNWHTLASDPMPPVPTPPNPPLNLYDLYSVTLHEGLHTLGFASRLGDNDLSTNPTIFSRWDRFLWSNNIMDYVLTPFVNPQAGCCDQMDFNPQFPTMGNFPPDLLNNCQSNVFFNDGTNNLAQVNANYTGTPTSGSINNAFSHLDRCGTLGPNYVMNGSIAAHEVRRVLDQAEVAILAALGYASPGATAQPCNVIAVDDVINVTLGDPNITIYPFVSISQLTINDLTPPGTILSIDVNCGNAIPAGIASVTSSSGYINILPSGSGLTPGQYTLCYTITGCNGQCDDGVLVINAAPFIPPLPSCPPADACSGDELWCHGDFEAMLPAQGTAQQQINTPDCGSGNTPDVLMDLSSGNRMVRIWNEGFAIPLNPGISPGCAIEVNFDASGPLASGITLSVGEKTTCEDFSPATCPGAPNGSYQCLADFIFSGPNGPTVSSSSCSDPQVLNWIPNCNYSGLLLTTPGPLALTSYTTNQITNTSSETWNYLYISGFNYNSWKYIDNLEVYGHCENEIELTSKEDFPEEVCPGEISTIDVDVCMTGSNLTPTDVTVNLDIPILPGLEIVPGSDFDGGQAVISGMTPGDCQTLTVSVQVGFNIPPGTTIPVGLSMEGTNVCLSPHSLVEYNIDVIECDDDCDADWSIVCFEEHGYFCVINGFGGSHYMQWVNPPFPANPNGHCQSLDGLTQGQPLTFNIFVYDQGLELCTLTVNTTLPCTPMRPDPDNDGRDKDSGQQIDQHELTIEVFPNPIDVGSAQDQVTVRFESEWEGQAQLRIYDVRGRIVSEHPIELALGENQKRIQLGSLPAGVYAISLVSPDLNFRTSTRLISVK